MKHIASLIAILFSIFFFSCSGSDDKGQDSVLKCSVSQMNFTAVGDTQIIYVTSDNSWKATVSADGNSWLTISPTSGNTNATIKVIAGINSQKTERNCSIQIKSGDKSISIPVIQSQFVSAVQISLSEELSLEEGESKQLTATIIPDNATIKKISWSVADTAIATIDSTGMIVARSVGKTTLSAKTEDGSNLREICKVTVFELREYVDLGLPSHTLWANRNIGAKQPWDTGDYFAWGILTSYEGGQIFNCNHYKYYNVTDHTWTKYVTSGDYGIPDGIAVLEAQDDAATYYWGPKWTMPTKAQYEELLQNCDWIRVNDYNADKYGWMVQSRRNKNNIFFPFTGQWVSTSADNDVKNHDPEWPDSKKRLGYYWTKSLALQNYMAEALCTTTSSYQVTGFWRHMGIPIRAVRK